MDSSNHPFDQSQEPELEVPLQVRRRKSLRLSRGPILLGLVLFGLLVAGVLPRFGQAEKLKRETAELAQEVPVVTVTRIADASSEGDLILPSNLQALDQTSINSRTSGYVRERVVDIGSEVKRGQLLALIESPELDAQAGQSLAQVAQANAGLQSSEAEWAKLKAAVVGAQADVSKSVSAYDQAEADLAHARARRSESESNIRVAESRVHQFERLLAQANADAIRSEAAMEFDRKTLNRWKELYKSNAVSGQDVDEKQADFDKAQAEVEARKAAVETAQAELISARETVVGARSEAVAASADVDSARGKLSAAKSTIDSYNANLQAAKASDRAGRANVHASSAAVAASNANTDRLRYLQAYERIVAPFDGVITARNVEVGDLVSPTIGGGGATDQTNAVTHSGLFGLARRGAMRAIVYVPEDAAAGIRVGQPASLTVQEYPQRIFNGNVYHVSGALDTSSRTLMVEVRVSNSDLVLRPGMYAQVTFKSAGTHAHLWIPADALIFDAMGTRIATVSRGQTLHYLSVKLGRDLGDRIEVLQGITGQEQIVLNPDPSVADGSKVSIVEAKN